MIESEKISIYDRLAAMNMKIEHQSIPNPNYISEKLGECHLNIEEVEKFYIKVSRELSVLQRALNNAETSYEQSKDLLLSTDPEIINGGMGSARDREARANNRLKNEITEIKNYKTDVEELERLLGVINVVLRNLSRANMDIKVQLRLMESQIKLGNAPIKDDSAKSLMAELAKGDMFQHAQTKMEESIVQDPSQIDISGVITVNNPLIPDNDMGCHLPVTAIPVQVPINNPSISNQAVKPPTPDQALNNPPIPEINSVELNKSIEEEISVEQVEEEIEEDLVSASVSSLDKTTEPVSEKIDLNSLLEPVSKTILPEVPKNSGGDTEIKIQVTSPADIKPSEPKPSSKEGTEFDNMISSYLSQFTPH
jgi:hypothetical protein